MLGVFWKRVLRFISWHQSCLIFRQLVFCLYLYSQWLELCLVQTFDRFYSCYSPIIHSFIRITKSLLFGTQLVILGKHRHTRRYISQSLPRGCHNYNYSPNGTRFTPVTNFTCQVPFVIILSPVSHFRSVPVFQVGLKVEISYHVNCLADVRWVLQPSVVFDGCGCHMERFHRRSKLGFEVVTDTWQKLDIDLLDQRTFASYANIRSPARILTPSAEARNAVSPTACSAFFANSIIISAF